MASRFVGPREATNQPEAPFRDRAGVHIGAAVAGAPAPSLTCGFADAALCAASASSSRKRRGAVARALQPRQPPNPVPGSTPGARSWPSLQNRWRPKTTTTSSSARARPAACWRTGSPPIRRRVLLLEAGGPDNWIWFHIPVGYLFAIGNPRSDWMFKTEPEPGLNGRSLNYPRGKVIGGSSAINAMIYMRGQAADYDHWRQLGLTGWGWDDVLPFFKQHEHHFLGASETSRASAASGGSRRRACAGTSSTRSARRPSRPASSRSTTSTAATTRARRYFHVNQRRGGAGRRRAAFSSRCSTGQPAARDRLPGRARRVRRQARRRRALAPGRRDADARCRGEVILAAGAIGSPQMLLLSGIGPGRASAGARHPGRARQAGRRARTCRIHLQLRLIYKVSGVKTLNETYHSLLGRARMVLDYALFRRGPLTMAPSQLGLFTRSDPSRERANIQFHVQPLSLDRFGEPLHDSSRLSPPASATCSRPAAARCGCAPPIPPTSR